MENDNPPPPPPPGSPSNPSSYSDAARDHGVPEDRTEQSRSMRGALALCIEGG